MTASASPSQRQVMSDCPQCSASLVVLRIIPGKAEMMARLSFKLAESFEEVDASRIHAAKPVAADFNAEFFDNK